MIKKIHLTPRSITNFLLKTVLVLFIFHVLAMVIKFTVENTTILMYVTIFDFDDERNFPSTYSALAILFAAFLLWQISKMEREKMKKHSIYWKVMSGVFVFLAIDEYTSIHEHAGHVLRLFTDQDFILQGWYVPVLIFFAILSLFFVKFFFQLPKTTRIRFVVAGVVFIAGAVGFEVLGGMYLERAEPGLMTSIILTTLITIEELLEMLGIILFITALTKYYLLDREKEGVKILCHLTENGVEPDYQLDQKPTVGSLVN